MARDQIGPVKSIALLPLGESSSVSTGHAMC
jgi:hypothetical protein